MIAKVKKNPTDPIAILVGGIIEILSALKVPSQLGLDAEQVAQIGGALIMIAAAIRFMLSNGKADAPAASASAPSDEENEKETPQETPVDDSSDEEDESDDGPDEEDESDDGPDEEAEKDTPVEPVPTLAPPPTTGGH